MVSLRFPFWFSRSAGSGRASHAPVPCPFPAAAIAIATVATTAGVAVASIASLQKQKYSKQTFCQDAMSFLFPDHSTPMWASLSLADNSSATESKTRALFPSVLSDSRLLLGVGLRKKSILGLKNIDIYAFGVYAATNDVEKFLSQKQGSSSLSELEQKKACCAELIEADVCMTVRLQIVYSKLSIHKVRSAFEESIGSRLQKLGGSCNKELLQRFTSQFKDEYKIPRGSTIDISRERGYILRTRIDGKEIGSIQSELLCRSVLDLYIGEEPFDRQAKEEIEMKLSSLLQK